MAKYTVVSRIEGLWISETAAKRVKDTRKEALCTGPVQGLGQPISFRGPLR